MLVTDGAITLRWTAVCLVVVFHASLALPSLLPRLALSYAALSVQTGKMSLS